MQRQFGTGRLVCLKTASRRTRTGQAEGSQPRGLGLDLAIDWASRVSTTPTPGTANGRPAPETRPEYTGREVAAWATPRRGRHTPCQSA
jgi:hypothetical protein